MEALELGKKVAVPIQKVKNYFGISVYKVRLIDIIILNLFSFLFSALSITRELKMTVFKDLVKHLFLCSSEPSPALSIQRTQHLGLLKAFNSKHLM